MIEEDVFRIATRSELCRLSGYHLYINPPPLLQSLLFVHFFSHCIFLTACTDMLVIVKNMHLGSAMILPPPPSPPPRPFSVVWFLFVVVSFCFLSCLCIINP